jgi:hypothetical protein
MHHKKLYVIILLAGALALLLGTVLAFAEDAPAAKAPTYVGSKACKTCHQGDKNGKVFETWMESKHAKALSALDSTKGETKDAKCLKCHTTGANSGGYGTAGMEAMDLAGVGCEACHGPGSEYKSMKVMKDKAAAKAAGLVIPDEKTCVKCHNSESPTFKSFSYAEMYKKIEHHVPKATEGAAPAEGAK